MTSAAPSAVGARDSSKSSKNIADFWFDPACPWAWLTSRWITEVEKVRDVEVRWHVMSLGILNERQPVPPEYAESIKKTWGPVRVIIAAQEEHGDEYVKRLYDAMGTRLHPGGYSDMALVISESLEEVGLPADLARFAELDAYDEPLRTSHARGIDLVGEDVGTPVVAFNGTAFFGPVITPAPKGEAAGRLWDGVILVSDFEGFYEIKRTRHRGPVFD